MRAPKGLACFRDTKETVSMQVLQTSVSGKMKEQAR